MRRILNLKSNTSSVPSQVDPNSWKKKKGSKPGENCLTPPKRTCILSFLPPAVGSVAGAPDRQKFDNSYIPDEFNHSCAGIVAGTQWRLDFGIGKAKLYKSGAEYQKMRNTQEFAEKLSPSKWWNIARLLLKPANPTRLMSRRPLVHAGGSLRPFPISGSAQPQICSMP